MAVVFNAFIEWHFEGKTFVLNGGRYEKAVNKQAGGQPFRVSPGTTLLFDKFTGER